MYEVLYQNLSKLPFREGTGQQYHPYRNSIFIVYYTSTSVSYSITISPFLPSSSFSNMRMSPGYLQNLVSHKSSSSLRCSRNLQNSLHLQVGPELMPSSWVNRQRNLSCIHMCCGVASGMGRGGCAMYVSLRDRSREDFRKQ